MQKSPSPRFLCSVLASRLTQPCGAAYTPRANLTGGNENADVAPPSEDFVLRDDEFFESDNGQIDGGVRYSVLLQVLVDFLSTDGGTSMPQDGLQKESNTKNGGVHIEPAVGQRFGPTDDEMLCRPCKL